MIDRITEVLRRLPPRVGEPEVELHRRVGDALLAAGIAFRSESRLGKLRGRVDYLCEGGVAVEIKIGYQSRGRLGEQARKYLASRAVAALIIVSERRIPDWIVSSAEALGEEAGKPVRVVELARGVAS